MFTSSKFKLRTKFIKNRWEERAVVKGAEASMQEQGLTTLSQKIANDKAIKQSEENTNKQVMGQIGSTALMVAGQVGMAALMASDERWKKNIEDIEDGLSLIRSLRPVSFNYNETYPHANTNRKHHGFIAQEYKNTFPDATFQDIAGKYSIDMIDCIAPLVRAVQQLENRLARLEAKQALATAS